MAITRKFQIEVLKDREISEQVFAYEHDPETNTKKRVLRERKRVVPEGYMVYFVGGHSIFVEHKAQLASLGLLPSDNTEIDTDTGLPAVPPQLQDLKAVVNRKTVQSERSLGA